MSRLQHLGLCHDVFLIGYLYLACNPSINMIDIGSINDQEAEKHAVDPLLKGTYQKLS